MKSIIINERQFEMKNCVRNGSESMVFHYGPTLILKKFYTDNIDVLDNKLNKLLILNETNIDFLVKPSYLAINKKHQLLGYFMQRINYGRYEDLLDITYDAQLSLKNKLEIIKKLENYVLSLNKRNIYVLDYNPTNFMFDNNHNIKFIDTDNYFVSYFKPDIIASNYQYTKTCGDDLDMSERFCFSMCALDVLMGFEFKALLFKECDRKSMFENVLENTNFPDKLNAYVENIISDPKQATFISPILESCQLNEKHFNRGRK